MLSVFNQKSLTCGACLLPALLSFEGAVVKFLGLVSFLSANR